MSAMPVFVALAADDESGSSEDKVGSAPGASSECLEGLVGANGRHAEVGQQVGGPLQLDA